MFNDIQNINGKNPFKVPENYFENFKMDIMLQVAAQTPQRPVAAPRINMWKRTLSWSAAAAVFLGVLFTLNNTLNNPQEIAPSKQNSHGILASTKTSDESEFYQFIEEQSTRGSFSETILCDEYNY